MNHVVIVPNYYEQIPTSYQPLKFLPGDNYYAAQKRSYEYMELYTNKFHLESEFDSPDFDLYPDAKSFSCFAKDLDRERRINDFDAENGTLLDEGYNSDNEIGEKQYRRDCDLVT